MKLPWNRKREYIPPSSFNRVCFSKNGSTIIASATTPEEELRHLASFSFVRDFRSGKTDGSYAWLPCIDYARSFIDILLHDENIRFLFRGWDYGRIIQNKSYHLPAVDDDVIGRIYYRRQELCIVFDLEKWNISVLEAPDAKTLNEQLDSKWTTQLCLMYFPWEGYPTFRLNLATELMHKLGNHVEVLQGQALYASGLLNPQLGTCPIDFTSVAGLWYSRWYSSIWPAIRQKSTKAAICHYI